MVRVDAIKQYDLITSLSTDFFFRMISDNLAAVFSHKTLYLLRKIFKNSKSDNVLVLQCLSIIKESKESLSNT